MTRRRIFIFIVTLLLIELVIISLRRSDDEQASMAEIKHFDKATIEKSIRLKDGLTIEDYIEKHIKIGNKLKNRIETNNTQIVVTTKQKPTEPESKKIKADYESGVEMTYKIMPGDTLLVLAKRYHTTPYKLKKLNNISNGDILRVGQKLRIIPEQKSTYRIRQGDNMATIAQKFGVDEDEIILLNGLESGRNIWVGQKLAMPISQKKIDAVLEKEKEKEQELTNRKKNYQRQLIARLARLKMIREQQRKVEEGKKKQIESGKRKKIDRIEKARRAFKYTPQTKFKHRIRVAATAYTSHMSQTDSTPFVAAWNNRLRPGMKIIAVSPDLIRKYGLTNGVRVKIGGLPGTYVVRDKMNARLHDHIDIYMGVDKRRALRWGHRYVMLYY